MFYSISALNISILLLLNQPSTYASPTEYNVKRQIPYDLNCEPTGPWINKSAYVDRGVDQQGFFEAMRKCCEETFNEMNIPPKTTSQCRAVWGANNTRAAILEVTAPKSGPVFRDQYQCTTDFLKVLRGCGRQNERPLKAGCVEFPKEGGRSHCVWPQ